MRAVRYATGVLYRTYGAVLFFEISSTHICRDGGLSKRRRMVNGLRGTQYETLDKI